MYQTTTPVNPTGHLTPPPSDFALFPLPCQPKKRGGKTRYTDDVNNHHRRPDKVGATTKPTTSLVWHRYFPGVIPPRRPFARLDNVRVTRTHSIPSMCSTSIPVPARCDLSWLCQFALGAVHRLTSYLPDRNACEGSPLVATETNAQRSQDLPT